MFPTICQRLRVFTKLSPRFGAEIVILPRSLSIPNDMNSYLLKVNELSESQSPVDDSFLGGKPKLPPGEKIPVCKLCGSEQSFMFQVAMPKCCSWKGMSLAVFACTSCAARGHFIPEMLSGPLHGAEIPEGFLERYQVNFRFLVFETALATIHEGYVERVKFKRVNLESVADPNMDFHKVGGNPTWVLEDESPKSYGKKIPMFFILQLLPGFQFEINPGAPRQVEMALDGTTTEASPFDYHELFIGNAIYLFGTDDRTQHFVYAITQI
jgi:hypothetical protein